MTILKTASATPMPKAQFLSVVMGTEITVTIKAKGHTADLQELTFSRWQVSRRADCQRNMGEKGGGW